MDVVVDFEEKVMEIDAYLSFSLTTVANQLKQIRSSFCELTQSFFNAQILDKLHLAVGFGYLARFDVESGSDGFS
jgi:hypothetical protein